MTRGSLVSSEKRSKALSEASTTSEFPADKMTPVSDDTATEETTRALAVELLLRGKSRSYVADKLGITEAKVFAIESDHYNKQEMLGEHAFLMKQLTRLEALLDAVWDRVMQGYIDDPKEYEAALSVLKEISELAGLKKTKVQAEVRLIQEQQVPMIVNFVQQVVSDMEKKTAPLLTKKGVLELEAHREEWLAEATQNSVNLIEEPTTIMSL